MLLEDTSKGKRSVLKATLVLLCSEYSFRNILKGRSSGYSAKINRLVAMVASEVGLGRVGLADLLSTMGLATPFCTAELPEALEAFGKGV